MHRLEAIWKELPIFVIGAQFDFMPNRVRAVLAARFGVFEQDYPVAKAVVNKMFDSFVNEEIPNIEYKYISVDIEDGLSEAVVCEKLTRDRPTILIDTTRRPRAVGNRAGTLVKKVVRKMGIPTVSATYGEMKGIMEWENLSDIERQYLVQIAPPGYIITQVVRDLASLQNMTTTGVLFDESIVVRILNGIQGTVTDGNRVHVRSVVSNLIPVVCQTTIPILFSVPRSRKYLKQFDSHDNASRAEANNMTGREYSWHLVSLDPVPPTCNCKKLGALWMVPRSKSQTKADTLARTFHIKSEKYEGCLNEKVRNNTVGINEDFIQSTSVASSEWALYQSSLGVLSRCSLAFCIVFAYTFGEAPYH
ncbi:ionotropic receptor 25a [Trichonephila clavipes]|nr:ionotropic receptor 25a [Trichonephila clavipes]